MKQYILFVITLLAITYTNAQVELAFDAQSPKEYGITTVEADSVYNKVKKLPDESQLSIALIKNGVVRFYGVHRKNDSIFSVKNHQNVFEIGSISKVFTSTMLAGLLLEDKLQVENYINDYLDIPFKDDQKISFQMLSNHTSGLPRMPTNMIMNFFNGNNPFEDYGAENLKEYLKDTMNLAEFKKPGEFEYSNLGAGLLGYTLTQIEKANYESLLQSRITTKYGLINTTTDRNKIIDLLLLGRNGGTVVPNWDMDVLVGAGGIKSNVEDLSKFALAQFDTANEELNLTRIQTTRVDQNTSVGLGWLIKRTKNDRTLYAHDGGTGGYTSIMTIDCEHKNGVIILSNISALGQGMDKIHKLARSLLNTIDDYR